MTIDDGLADANAGQRKTKKNQEAA